MGTKTLHEKYIQFQIVSSQISFYLQSGNCSFPVEKTGRHHFNHVNTINNGKHLNHVHHIVMQEGYSITYIIFLPKIRTLKLIGNFGSIQQFETILNEEQSAKQLTWTLQNVSIMKDEKAEALLEMKGDQGIGQPGLGKITIDGTVL